MWCGWVSKMAKIQHSLGTSWVRDHPRFSPVEAWVAVLCWLLDCNGDISQMMDDVSRMGVFKALPKAILIANPVLCCSRECCWVGLSSVVSPLPDWVMFRAYSFLQSQWEDFLCSLAPLFLLPLLHPLLLLQLLEPSPDEEQRLIAGKASLHIQSRQCGQLLWWLQGI